MATGRPIAPVAAARGPSDDEATPPPLEIRFEGTGWAYARIWVTNALLVLLTLGLGYPWARLRTLRYFCSNTFIGNGKQQWHPLVFDASARRMLPGHMLVLALVATYLIGSDPLGPLTTALFVGMALLLPVLLRSSLRFRFGNLRWRGLTFAFDGSLGQAYVACWPLLAAMLGLPFAMHTFGSYADHETPVPIYSFWIVLTVAVMLSMLAVRYWRLPCYQLRHLRFGKLATRLELARHDFRRFRLRAVLTLVLYVTVCLMLTLDLTRGSRPDDDARVDAVVSVVSSCLLISVLAWRVSLAPWLVAQAQNLFITNTSDVSARLTLRSCLPPERFATLSAGCGLLTLATLGLFWPFAAVRLVRLRLEAISIETRVDVTELRASSADRGAGSGEFAASIFHLGGVV